MFEHVIKNDVTAAVLERQTIREYTPEMLTDAQLDTVMAAAMMAPSGRNSQPCHVRFIKNSDMLKEMQIDFKNIVGWDTPVHTRSDKNPFYHNAPVFAAIFAEGASYMDAGIMVENICIAAKGLGLGTCIVASVGALFEDADKGAKWRRAIDIPEDYRFLIGVAIGNPDEKPEQKPRDESHYKVIE